MAEKITTFFDGLGAFSRGINSGASPFALPHEQCAFALNATFRGEYITSRPPFRKQILVFTSTDVQTGFTKGLFQGACYYRPDAGAQQLIVSISGRIFRCTPDNVKTIYIDEITIAGDPNSAIQPQAWLWQSERWVIIQNGLQTPIFYDGISCRRSRPISEVVGTVDVAG